MTNPTMHKALRQLIDNDAYAETFQTMGQYRAALLQHLDQLLENSSASSQVHPESALPSMANYDNTAQQYAALACRPQPKGGMPVPVWGRMDTVGDMVRNLLTLDQAAPIFTAFHVDVDGQRRCRTRGITISRERVIDGKWIDSSRNDVPYANIVWAKPDERAQQAAAPGYPAVEQSEALELFKGWKGYPLPEFNADGNFDSDWLHREWVAFQAGMDLRPSAPGTPEAPDEEHKGIALWQATMRACGELPEGYEVRIELENGCGMAVWYDNEGERHVIDGEGYLSDDVNEAVDAAIQRAAQLDGGQGAGA